MARSPIRSNRRSQSAGGRFRNPAWLVGSVCLMSLGCTAASVVPRAEPTRPTAPRFHASERRTTDRATTAQNATARQTDAPLFVAADDPHTRNAGAETGNQTPNRSDALPRTAPDRHEKVDSAAATNADQSAAGLPPKFRIPIDSDDEQAEIASLRAIRDAHPQSARDQNKVGKLLLNTTAEEEGLAALRRAVALAPRKAGYACDLAAAHIGRNDPDAARRTLVEARFRMPLDRSLPLALARLEESTGDWQRAADAYRQTLELDPQDRSSRKHRARCLYRLHDFETARAEFERCTDSREEGLSLSEGVLYGDACLRTGRFAAARNILQHLSQRSPVRSREVELLRVLCEIRCGDRIRAREILETAATLWPDDARIAALRSRARFETGKPDATSGVIATEWSPARKPPHSEHAAGEEVEHAPETPRDFREPITSAVPFSQPVGPAEPEPMPDSSGPLIVPGRSRNATGVSSRTSAGENMSESVSKPVSGSSVSGEAVLETEPMSAPPSEGWRPTKSLLETELPVITPRRRR